MADEKPEQDDTLTKVARTVGSALGTVASTVNEVVAPKPDEPARASTRTSRPRNAAAATQKQRAQDKKKAKRAKHKRKLGRRTRG